MYFTLFLSMSLLNYGFTQKKKGDGVAEDQRKLRVQMGQLLQMKFKSMIRSENICFIHSGKQNGCGEYEKEKGVMF